MNWLKKNNFKISILIISFLVSIITYLYSNNNTEIGRVFFSWFLVSLPIVFISFILIFIKKEQVFYSWINFTKYVYFFVLPLSLIHVGDSQGGFFALPVIFDFIFDFIFIILYSLISLGIIIYQSFNKN